MFVYRAIVDGFIMVALYWIAKQYGAKKEKKSGFELPMIFLMILLSTFSTVALYRGQENSNYFFWHPYLSWLIVDLSDFAFSNHKVKEKLLLWPFIIIPIIAGFELAVGWLIKLYVWKI